MQNSLNLNNQLKRKKFLFIISLILILLFTSSCQSQSNIDSNSQNKITTITFWHGINPPENRIIFEEFVTKFNQNNPQIKVEPLYIGQPDEQIPKIIASIVGKQTPDLLWYAPQLTGKLVELQAIKPLDEWLNNSPLKDEIDPANLSRMVLDKKIYSIPFAANNTAVFYRPSLFKKAGITTLPTTWNEFKEVAKKLTIDSNNDGINEQTGLLLASGKGEFVVFVWLPLIFSANGEILTNNEVNLVSNGTEKALQLGIDLIKEKAAILSAPERGYELDNFISGKVAMQITGSWTLAQLDQSGIDYDVFPIPIIEKPATVLGGENIFLFNTNSEKEKASLKFLEYILGEEFQTQWALKTGYLPINIKAQKNAEYQTFLQEKPVLKVFLDQMQWAKSRPITSNYPSISENLGRAIESSLLQEKTPKLALEEAQKRFEMSN